jgi:hypothetical protein
LDLAAQVVPDAAAGAEGSDGTVGDLEALLLEKAKQYTFKEAELDDLLCLSGAVWCEWLSMLPWKTISKEVLVSVMRGVLTAKGVWFQYNGTEVVKKHMNKITAPAKALRSFFHDLSSYRLAMHFCVLFCASRVHHIYCLFLTAGHLSGIHLLGHLCRCQMFALAGLGPAATICQGSPRWSRQLAVCKASS